MVMDKKLIGRDSNQRIISMVSEHVYSEKEEFF